MHAWNLDIAAMQRIVTLSDRKAAEAVRRQDAVAALAIALSAYAQAHGGRFLLYGSAARGTMKYDSGVDLLLDFPDDALADAWGYAETACWDRGLEPDLLPLGWCKTAFLEHITPDVRVLA